MSQLYDLAMEHIEIFGANFFDQLTPQFLFVQDLEFARLFYQFSMGVLLFFAFSFVIIYIVDRSNAAREKYSSENTMRTLRNLRNAYAVQAPSTESALDVMRQRQMAEKKRALKGVEGQYFPQAISKDHLPTFFKSK